MFKINYIDADDPILNFLQQNGYTCSAQLFSFEIEDQDDCLPIHMFLHDEIRRLQDFLRICVLTNVLPFKKDRYSLRHYVSLAPIFRVVLEGFFRIDYVFCKLEMGSLKDWDLLIERFEEIVAVAKYHYNDFVTRRSGVLEISLNTLGEPGEKWDRRKKPDLYQVWDMVEKTQKDAPKQKDESDQKIAYATYSFCCFYSHANMNRGLIESMGANDFAHVDFNILMEAFSSYYLKLLCFLLKKSPFKDRLVDGITSSEESSKYLS